MVHGHTVDDGMPSVSALRHDIRRWLSELVLGNSDIETFAVPLTALRGASHSRGGGIR